MERHRERKAPPHRVGAPCTVGRAGSDATVSAEPSDRHLDQRTAERYTLTAVPECRPVCLLWSGAHGTATGHTHHTLTARGPRRRPAPAGPRRERAGDGVGRRDQYQVWTVLCGRAAPDRPHAAGTPPGSPDRRGRGACVRCVVYRTVPRARIAASFAGARVNFFGVYYSTLERRRLRSRLFANFLPTEVRGAGPSGRARHSARRGILSTYYSRNRRNGQPS